MAKEGMNLLIIVGIAIVAYVLIFQPDFGGDDTAIDDMTGSTGECNVEDISFQAKMTRLGKAGTSLSTASNNYFVVTDTLGTFAGSASATVPTNYDLQVIFGENSTTYYSVVRDVDTGCQDPKFESVSLAFADSDIDPYAENSDGTINSVSNQEAMDADDQIEFTLCVKASPDAYFGNPDSSCENVGVVEYDATYFRNFESSLGSANYNSFTPDNATNDAEKAFIIPKVGDGEKECFTLSLESTTNNPTGSYPIVHMYDCNIDKDEDTLAIIEGVQDEDDNSLALQAQTQTLYIS